MTKNGKKVSLLMLSTFGPNVRGVSPYADHLTAGIEQLPGMFVRRLDYEKAFPDFFLPANTNYLADNDDALIHYAKPGTWNPFLKIACDIIHIQYWSPAFLPVLLMIVRNAEKKGVKVILTWHNAAPHEKLPLISLLEQKLLKSCHRLICHTESGLEMLCRRCPGVRGNVIPHGCRPNRIQNPGPMDYDICGLSDQFEYLLFFGNIRPYKGVDLLLDAWGIICREFPMTRLVIAGRLWGKNASLLKRIPAAMSGTYAYAKSIFKKMQENDEQLICDLNFIPEEKLKSYLAVSRLAVFPYKSFESQSGAASLAAGNGLPIITTDVGGLSELSISPAFCAGRKATSASLATLIKNRLQHYKKEWRARQFEIASNRSWEKVARLHQEVYQSVISE